MQRFFISPERIQENRVDLPEAIARQLFSVLRMRGGEEIILLDNSGWEYSAKILQITAKNGQAEILKRAPSTSEPPLHITLYQCLLKKENFEWVLQKGTEIGVSAFVPVISTRSIPDQLSPTKIQRWERILTEAAEQSRRGKIPQLRPLMTFSQAIHAMQAADLRLIPWEDENHLTLKTILTADPNIHSVAVCIGAEGGFTLDEIESARQVGVIPVTFGQRILRAETAAIYVATAIAFQMF